SDSVSACAPSRATVSVFPPAGKGTTIRTGRCGQFSACAGWCAISAARNATDAGNPPKARMARPFLCKAIAGSPALFVGDAHGFAPRGDVRGQHGGELLRTVAERL